MEFINLLYSLIASAADGFPSLENRVNFFPSLICCGICGKHNLKCNKKNCFLNLYCFCFSFPFSYFKCSYCFQLKYLNKFEANIILHPAVSCLSLRCCQLKYHNEENYFLFFFPVFQKTQHECTSFQWRLLLLLLFWSAIFQFSLGNTQLLLFQFILFAYAE